MAIVSLICSIVSAGCAVFGVIFSIYLHQQQRHNDDKNLLTACQVEKINKSKMLNKRG